MEDKVPGQRRHGVLGHLWSALDLRLSELLQADFWAGVAGMFAFGALGWFAPTRLLALVDATTGLVGVVIGAVLSAAALIAAFYDQAFLRKLRMIGSDPVRYLAPFFFTIVTGMLALGGLLVLAVLTKGDAQILIALTGAFVGFFAVWTMVSLLPLMATLVQFIRLKVDALDVPDDLDLPRGKKTGTDGLP